jgi:formate hydrogenlyase subunit 3/multisubunit Na+/H+ antiporter MnhD subunit
MIWVWIAILTLPTAVALLLLAPSRLRAPALAVAPWTAVPALLVSLVPDIGDTVSAPWLLLGSWLGLDLTGRVFLFFTALLWTATGWYGRAYLSDDASRSRFFGFFLLAMTGNLGLIIAQDVASFYMFFALMTFAAYGLVVHTGGSEPVRAGRVYLTMSIIGEMLMLAGFLLAVQAADTLMLEAIPAAVAGSAQRNIIVGLLLAGFGVKVGAIPLHVWLPLAHPVAPTPASAVLSGCMIKAGLLGWLRFLPLGEAALPTWGAFVVGIGLFGAFYGVAVGLMQSDPKTNLAYSSISQMGLATIAVGIGLAEPEAWPAALTAVLIFTLHHSLAKGALFLGVGVAQTVGDRPRRLNVVLGGLGLAALALAAAPLTGGATAKLALKYVVAGGPELWTRWLDMLIPITSIATALLMGRFLILVRRQARALEPHATNRQVQWSWGVLLVGSMILVWLIPGFFDLDIEDLAPADPQQLWDGLWPILAAAATLSGLMFLMRRAPVRPAISVAAGDVLLPVERLLGILRGRVRWMPPPAVEFVESRASSWYGLLAEGFGRGPLARIERRVIQWEMALMLFLVVTAVVFLLVWWGARLG